MLQDLRAPFVAAGKGALTAPSTATWLDERLERDPTSVEAWGLRFESETVPAQRASIAARLERAYRRGEIAGAA